MTQSILMKKNGKRRVLDVPSNDEKRRQRLLLSYLSPQFESLFSDCSYGYRKGRGPKDAVEEFRKNVNEGYQWTAYIDVKDCFDSINPSSALGLIDSRITDYYPEEVTGLPQGHPLSPLLCNMYLDLFDKEMERHVQPSQIKDLDFKFIRSADDVWLMTRRRKALELYTSLAVQFLNRLGLNSRAPTIRHVNQGVDVLGYTAWRWTTGPSTKSLRRLHDRLIRLVCRHLELKNEVAEDDNTNEHADNTYITQCIDQYDHIKTGWTNYYGRDTWKTTGQWQTLDNWIAMTEHSRATPRSDTKNTSVEVSYL